MENIQLAILLEKYKIMLDNAIQQVIKDLPDDLKETQRNLIGQTNEFFPVMQPIEEVLSCIDEDVELLKKISFKEKLP